VSNFLAIPGGEIQNWKLKLGDPAEIAVGNSFLNKYGAVIQNNILTLTVPILPK